MAMILESAAFENGGNIPIPYTPVGEDLSPPLEWSGVPEGAESLVLIVEDRDAPFDEQVHWLLYNIPADAEGLAEAVAKIELPQGTEIGLNDWGLQEYGGPCPTDGEHRYVIRLLALDTVLHGLHQPHVAEIEMLMEDHVLATATLVGRCGKQPLS